MASSGPTRGTFEEMAACGATNMRLVLDRFPFRFLLSYPVMVILSIAVRARGSSPDVRPHPPGHRAPHRSTRRMTNEAFRRGWMACIAVAAALASASTVSAQTTTQPSTLRYGSGLMDIPVGSVLPHLTITGTWSGFFTDVATRAVINSAAEVVGWTNGESRYYSDGAVALGLFDRVEVGTTIQTIGDESEGGNTWGLFGRVQLVKPENQGVSVAVGGRYVTAPDFGDDVNRQPTRLGVADERLRDSYMGHSDEVQNEMSVYAVATGHFRGPAIHFMPEHDFTISGGYGTGMFQGGDFLEFYRFADSEGWFVGSALHIEVGGGKLVTLMGEYNGFDLNFGAQIDVNGVRIGGHVLGANYRERPVDGYYSIYRSPKVGVVASVALSPSGSDGVTAGPHLMMRPIPDTVVIPPPPPDTVVVTREVAPPIPDGMPVTACLATGLSVQIHVSSQGDTLVGPMRIPISDLGPGIVFEGDYAGGTEWFSSDESITFERREYDKSGNEVSLDCADIMRVGEHMGIAIFVMRDAERPFGTLYVPVRAGAWQAYQPLRGTRG